MIALAFLLIARALTIEDLESVTGLHNDTVRAAVKGLASKGLLYKQVGERGRATWLPAGDTFFGRLMQNPKTSDSGVYDDVVVELEERKKISATSLTTRPQNPKTSDSGVKPAQAACLAALTEAGIHGRKAKQLAKLDWVTVEYIRGHFEQVQHETWDNPQGMMIYRIEENVPVEDAPAQKDFGSKFVDGGKYRQSERIVYTFDLEAHVADFMGHEKGCRCFDCVMLRASHGDTRVVCSTCKHHECTCEESEEE